MNNARTHRLLEADIKARLIEFLRQTNYISKATTIINEFTLDGYTRRADLVIVNNKKLEAFEIKSEADNLYRLSDQIKKYKEFFDKITIVSVPKHTLGIIGKADKANAIWEVTEKKFKIIRRGRFEPIKESTSLIKLMTVSELWKFSRSQRLAPQSKRRRYLAEVVKSCSVSQLRDAALSALKKRYNMSSQAFWNKVDNSFVDPLDLSFLSTIKNHKRLSNAEAENASFWETWHAKVENLPEDPWLLQMSSASPQPLFGALPEHIKHLTSGPS